ncbi:MAG: RNA polymerase factor sigma-54 [Anaerovoracaceae bacterium]
MKQSFELTIEQTQKLSLTPELIQAIKLLQYNSLELHSYLKEQLLVNPALEMENEIHSEAFESNELFKYIQKREERKENFGSKEYGRKYYEPDKDYSLEQIAASKMTLEEHLMYQFQFVSKGQKCRQIGKYIIESLDENGYLGYEIEEISSATDSKAEDVEKVLSLIHGLEPAGIATKDIRESLLVQLDEIGLRNESYEVLINNYFELLASNSLSVIAKEMKKTSKEIQEMKDVISKLNPRPAANFDTGIEASYVIADAFIRNKDGNLSVEVNQKSVPMISVCSYFQDVIRDSQNDPEVLQYLNKNLNSANWIINCIKQRNETIKNVVNSILKLQRDFFEGNNKELHVLTLKDVADDVGIHESTVSRAITGKYIECCHGILPMKYFFSSGVDCSESGHENATKSSNSIKLEIQELIDGEDKSSPISDQSISDTLKAQGIQISRRTVTKYRESIGIGSSTQRRRY